MQVGASSVLASSKFNTKTSQTSERKKSEDSVSVDNSLSLAKLGGNSPIYRCEVRVLKFTEANESYVRQLGISDNEVIHSTGLKGELTKEEML